MQINFCLKSVFFGRTRLYNCIDVLANGEVVDIKRPVLSPNVFPRLVVYLNVARVKLALKPKLLELRRAKRLLIKHERTKRAKRVEWVSLDVAVCSHFARSITRIFPQIANH